MIYAHAARQFFFRKKPAELGCMMIDWNPWESSGSSSCAHVSQVDLRYWTCDFGHGHSWFCGFLGIMMVGVHEWRVCLDVNWPRAPALNFGHLH